MKGMIRFTLAVLLLAVIVQAQILKKIAEFDVPGPTGKRFDYLTIDPDDHYLISAHLAGRTDVHHRSS